VTAFRWIVTLLSFAAAIGVSVFLIASSWPEGGAPLGLPWWGHLSALGAVALEIWLRAIKIQFSARAVGIPLSLGVSTRTILGGDFAASITPSRSGAEPARFLVLTEARLPVASVLLILFLELFLELISLVCITAVFAIVLDRSGRAVGTMTGLIGGYAAFVLGGGFFALMLARRNSHGPPPGWAPALGLHAGRWRRVQRSLRQLRESVAALRRARRSTMSAALCFSILHVLARLLILPIIVYTYGGNAPAAPLLVWPLALLYGGAVAPAPAGGGVVEFGFKVALAGTIPPRLLAASLIWWRVYSFYVYLAVGAIATGGTVMRALARMDMSRLAGSGRRTGFAPGDARRRRAVRVQRHDRTGPNSTSG
jgi:glycosyltransferase 2 family protein